MMKRAIFRSALKHSNGPIGEPMKDGPVIFSYQNGKDLAAIEIMDVTRFHLTAFFYLYLTLSLNFRKKSGGAVLLKTLGQQCV
jgi:hypothetical protein